METPPALTLAVLAPSYIVAPESVNADELAAMALALIADADLPPMQVLASTSCYRDGSLTYSVTAYDLDPVRNPLDIHSAYGLASSAKEALRQLSGSLSKWAMDEGLKPGSVLETANQKTRIIRLLNHPNILKNEKSRVLARLSNLTNEQAAALITDLDARCAHGWEPRYAVVGEAYQVNPARDCGMLHPQPAA